MSEKPIVWLGSSLANLRAFPGRARQYAGFELGLVQQGLDPTDWRPMPAVCVGVREIRIHTGREHRVLYLAQRADAVCVLHAFEKKSNRTPQSDIQLADVDCDNCTGDNAGGDHGNQKGTHYDQCFCRHRFPA